MSSRCMVQSGVPHYWDDAGVTAVNPAPALPALPASQRSPAARTPRHITESDVQRAACSLFWSYHTRTTEEGVSMDRSVGTAERGPNGKIHMTVRRRKRKGRVVRAAVSQALGEGHSAVPSSRHPKQR